MSVCSRCGHGNESTSNYCSSCGNGLAHAAVKDDTTLTLAVVNAADDADDLSQYLEGLPAGVALLVAQHGPAAGSSFRLDRDTIAVGRHPGSEIFLDDITVSRRHVTITRTGAGFAVRDAGSLNGMYVNRQRCDEARLHHGDELQVGRFRLRFVENAKA